MATVLDMLGIGRELFGRPSLRLAKKYGVVEKKSRSRIEARENESVVRPHDNVEECHYHCVKTSSRPDLDFSLGCFLIR